MLRSILPTSLGDWLLGPQTLKQGLTPPLGDPSSQTTSTHPMDDIFKNLNQFRTKTLVEHRANFSKMREEALLIQEESKDAHAAVASVAESKEALKNLSEIIAAVKHDVDAKIKPLVSKKEIANIDEVIQLTNDALSAIDQLDDGIIKVDNGIKAFQAQKQNQITVKQLIGEVAKKALEEKIHIHLPAAKDKSDTNENNLYLEVAPCTRPFNDWLQEITVDLMKVENHLKDFFSKQQTKKNIVKLIESKDSDAHDFEIEHLTVGSSAPSTPTTAKAEPELAQIIEKLSMAKNDSLKVESKSEPAALAEHDHSWATEVSAIVPAIVSRASSTSGLTVALQAAASSQVAKVDVVQAASSLVAKPAEEKVETSRGLELDQHARFGSEYETDFTTELAPSLPKSPSPLKHSLQRRLTVYTAKSTCLFGLPPESFDGFSFGAFNSVESPKSGGLIM